MAGSLEAPGHSCCQGPHAIPLGQGDTRVRHLESWGSREVLLSAAVVADTQVQQIRVLTETSQLPRPRGADWHWLLHSPVPWLAALAM